MIVSNLVFLHPVNQYGNIRVTFDRKKRRRKKLTRKSCISDSSFGPFLLGGTITPPPPPPMTHCAWLWPKWPGPASFFFLLLESSKHAVHIPGLCYFCITVTCLPFAVSVVWCVFDRLILATLNECSFYWLCKTSGVYWCFQCL